MRISTTVTTVDPPVALGQPPYQPELSHSLHSAVLADRVSAARAALLSGAAVDSANTQWQSPLFVAALRAHAACVRLLLEFGASVNLRCGELGCTPVHAACYSGSGRVLRMVLAAGGDLRLCDLCGRLPADWARLQTQPARRLKILRLVEGVRLTGSLQNRDSSSGTSGSLTRSYGLRGLLRTMLNVETPPAGCRGEFSQSAAATISSHWSVDCCESALQSDEGVHYTLGAYTEMSPHLYLHTAVSLRRLIPSDRVTVHQSTSVDGDDNSACVPPSDLLIEECVALRRLRHPALLLLMAVVPTARGSSVSLLFERVELGSLYTCLHRDRVNFTAKHLAQIGLQVCGALRFIHASGWLHCAITSHAVQLMSRGRAKLACLEYAVDTTVGSSAVGARHWRLLACRGANAVYGWMAAELMRSGVPTVACDVYSLCAVLWEMVHVQVPFADLSARVIQRLVLEQNRQLEVSSSLSPPFIAELLSVGLRHCVSDRDLQLTELQFMLTALLHSDHSAWQLGTVWQHCSISDASETSSDCKWQHWHGVRAGASLHRRASTGGVVQRQRHVVQRRSMYGRPAASTLSHRQTNLTPPREPCYSLTSGPNNCSLSQLMAELSSCQLNRSADEPKQSLAYSSAVNVSSSPNTVRRGPVQRRLSWLKKKTPLPSNSRDMDNSGTTSLSLSCPGPQSLAKIEYRTNDGVESSRVTTLPTGVADVDRDIQTITVDQTEQSEVSSTVKTAPATAVAGENTSLVGRNDNYDSNLKNHRELSPGNHTLPSRSPQQKQLVTSPVFVTSLQCHLSPQASHGGEIGVENQCNQAGHGCSHYNDIKPASDRGFTDQNLSPTFADKVAFFESHTDASCVNLSRTVEDIPQIGAGIVECRLKRSMVTSTPHERVVPSSIDTADDSHTHGDQSHFVTCAEFSDSLRTVCCAADSTQSDVVLAIASGGSQQQPPALSDCPSFNSHTAGVSSADTLKRSTAKYKNESPRKDVRFSPVVSSMYSGSPPILSQCEEMDAERVDVVSSTSLTSHSSPSDLTDANITDECGLCERSRSDPVGVCTAVDSDVFYNDDDDLLHVNRTPNLQLMSRERQQCCCSTSAPSLEDFKYRDVHATTDEPEYNRKQTVDDIIYREGIRVSAAADEPEYARNQLDNIIYRDDIGIHGTVGESEYTSSGLKASSIHCQNISGGTTDKYECPDQEDDEDIDEVAYKDINNNYIDVMDSYPSVKVDELAGRRSGLDYQERHANPDLGDDRYNHHGLRAESHSHQEYDALSTNQILDDHRPFDSCRDNHLQEEQTDSIETGHGRNISTPVLPSRDKSDEALRSYDEIEVSPNSGITRVRHFELTCHPGQSCSVHTARDPSGAITVTQTRRTCHGDLLSEQSDRVDDTEVQARISVARNS